MFQCLPHTHQASNVAIQVGENQGFPVLSVIIHYAGHRHTHLLRENGCQYLFMPVWERQNTQEADTLLCHGDKMHMGIDPVKAQFHTSAFVGLQQGLQRQIHMLSQ